MPAQVPAFAHYREATVAGTSCSTCDFYDDGICEAFEGHPAVRADYVCDRYQGRIDKQEPTTDDRYASHWNGEDMRLIGEMTAALEPTQKADSPRAAGIAVRAADTGRVLMLQRSHANPRDPAAGKWEFPGGCLNPGEHPYTAAKREWQEEMGARLPAGNHVGQWRSGVYHGFVHEVPSEDKVKLNADPEDRRVLNPDDPDGDDIEVAAWWHPHDMKRSPAIRQELRDSRPWDKVAKADEPQKGGVLYLVSHAKTRYNRPGQPHDIVQGWRDIPLDQQGRDQARELGVFLKKQGVETIYASNLRRALQTATIAGHAAGIKVVPDAAFRPWNLGDFAGHSSADVLPKLKPYMRNPERKVDGGESFNEYEHRFLPALEKVLTLAEHGHRVALVTHSRNVETVEGWLGGHGYRKKVDTAAIERDRIEPATVIEVSDKGGKLASGEFIQIGKGQAHPATVHLRVHGVSRTPDGMRVYRMATREGHYVGRTLPTRTRARKGDVLKIQTTDFLADVQGDMHWQNPAVEAHYNDAPHSWRELQALAGGTLVKDGADGAAGDIPAAGDMGASDALPSGNTAALASGPTSGSVHVNVPLKDISVGYANRRLIAQALRKDGSYDEATLAQLEAVVKGTLPMKQLVYGVVLEPNTLDSQDDYMLPHHVEKAAHGYLARVIRGKASVAKLQHRAQGFKKTVPSLVPVESYIAPVDFALSSSEQVRAGSWVMVMKVEDDALWQDFLDGKYTGFSIGGVGVRRSMKAGNYAPIVPHGYMQREPADWPIAPHPDTVGALLI